MSSSRPRPSTLKKLPKQLKLLSSSDGHTDVCRCRCATNSKRWDPKFFQKRDWTDQPFVETRKQFGLKIDLLETFLRANDTGTPPFGYRVITEWCQKFASSTSTSKSTLQQKNPTRAWLHIQPKVAGHSQSEPQWLDAIQLGDMLRQRFVEGTQPKSYRQLICIRHLDLQFVRSLAATAWYHQVPALRDAIHKHIARATSIGVYIPSPHFGVFSINFHFNRLVYAEEPITRSRIQAKNKGKDESILFCLDFLDPTTRSARKHRPVIQIFHTSLLICGWDHSKWAAFAFTNLEGQQDLNSGSDSGENTDEESDSENDVSNEEDHNDDMPAVDILAADAGFLYDTTNPEWDPRIYGLILIEGHIGVAVEEWGWLIQKLGEHFETWESKHPVEDLGKSYYKQSHQMNEGLTWTVRMTKVLRELSDRLVINIGALDKFNISEYFIDMKDPKAMSALESVKQASDTLRELQIKLKSLDRRCGEDSEQLRLFLSIESAQASLESNWFTAASHRIAFQTQQVALASHLNAVLMLSSNQFLAPVIVVTGYFSTQEQIFGFARNSRTFSIGIFVVFIALRIVTYLTYYTRRYFKLKGIVAAILLGLWDQPEEITEEEDGQGYAGGGFRRKMD